MNFHRHDHVCYRIILLLVAIICAGLPGCRQAKSSTSAQGQPNDDHGHGRPPHKPYDIHGAVLEVSRRGHELIHFKSPNPQATAELLDIIRWLPEFAADTDLTRPQWEQVREISKRLETWATPVPQGDSSFQAPAHAILDQSLTELRKIATLVPQPTGENSESGHAHDHHDHDHKPAEKSDDSGSFPE